MKTESIENETGLAVRTPKVTTDWKGELDLGLELARFQSELARAHALHMSMLPEFHFVSSEVEIASFCSPAYYVGGDYYDHFPLSDAKFGLVIADVTGHSLSSGLLAAMAKSCVHTQARFDGAPEEMMEALSRVVKTASDRNLLMSCCYVVLDFADNTLSYVNAGHPYPLLYQRASDVVNRLESTAPPLGVMQPARYRSRRARWSPGDLLVLYTDGLTDVHCNLEALSGDTSVEQILFEQRYRSPGHVRDALLDGMAAPGELACDDDVTVVVVRAK